MSNATGWTRPLAVAVTVWLGLLSTGCEKKCQCICACERNEEVSFTRGEDECTLANCETTCRDAGLRFAGRATCTPVCCTD